jgi:hypothetical protein
MRCAFVLVLLVACSDKKAATQPRPELLETITVLADSACACSTDKDCLGTVRADWDAQKIDIMNHGLAGDHKARFDAELQRMRSCGDAGGLTFWMPPPRE